MGHRHQRPYIENGMIDLNTLYARFARMDFLPILLKHQVKRADKQTETDSYAYQTAGSRTPDLRISRGERRGGTYDGLAFWWQRPNARPGYGAIELEAALSGLGTDGEDLRKVMSNLASIVGEEIPDLKKENENGILTTCEPQDEFTLEQMDGFTPEALRWLGCGVRRQYAEEGPARKAVENAEGNPVFLYDFGPQAQRKFATKDNFDTDRLHRDFHLYQVRAYTTARRKQRGEEVSLRREAHAFFPIFAVVHKQKDASGHEAVWGQVVQPNWHGKDDRGTFYFFNGKLNRYNALPPLCGDETCRLVFDGMTVPKAVEKAATGEELVRVKTMRSEEDGKVTEEEVKLSDADVRVDNVVLCRDLPNAVCTYYHLNQLAETYSYNTHLKDTFFHVAWMSDPKADFSTFMFSQLGKLATNKFLMLDIDNSGKKQAFKICKRFTKFRMAFLPERLKDFGNRYVGGEYRPCRDILAFFDKYTLSEEESYGYEHDINLLFLSCLNRALPIEPLVYCEKRDKKTGKLLEYYYKMDSACLWQFMATEGYCREVDHETSDKIGRFIHINGPFVEELDVKSVLSAAVTSLTALAQRTARMGTEDFRKMSNAIINAKEISEKTTINLPEMDVDYRSGYGPKLDHLFYRNGVLRITPDSIDFLSYNDIDFCVDRAGILPFDFVMPCAKDEAPFSITENPEYKERLKELEKHRKDVAHYTQEQLKMEEKEITAWAQRNRWLFDFKGKPVSEWWQPLQVLRCFANENYEKEEALQREGKEFDEEDLKTLYGHLANILYSLGRPLFRYKGGGTNYMPYITENGVTAEGKSEGGSGKSVFVNIFMGCAGKIFRVNARNIKIGDDITLELAQYIHHGHRVIHWEDMERIPIDPLYNYITSGFQYRKRHRDEVRVMLKDSPGHVTTSNYQQTYSDPSSSGRVVPTGFSHRFNRGDIRQNKPARKISDVMPGLRDDPEDIEIGLRSQIAYLCAMAIQFCMKTDDRVLPPMEELNYRSRVVSMGASFMAWAEMFFAKPYVYNCPIDIETIFSDYVESCESSEDKKTKFALSAFKGKLTEYCQDKSITMLPDVCFSSDTDRLKGYMRVKAWVKEVYFDDDKIWKDMRKEIRVLKQSNKCVFFCHKGQEPKDNREVKLLCKRYYEQPDPEPILDADGKPITCLTQEEQMRWDNYLASRQGRWRKPEITPDKPEMKEGEVKPEEDLPF